MQAAAVTANTLTPRATTDRGVSSLKSEDFFKLLVTELKNQDPFEPAKTADMIGQVSQIRSIELSKNLTDALTQMNRQQHAAGASELIGKYVVARVRAGDGTESAVAGIVTGVRFASDGSAILELDTGQTVSLADVTRITSPEAAEGQGGAKKSGQSQDNTAPTGSAAQTGKAEGRTKRLGLLPWLSLDAEIHL